MKHIPVSESDIEDLCKSKPKKIIYDDAPVYKEQSPLLIGNLPSPGKQVSDSVLGYING